MVDKLTRLLVLAVLVAALVVGVQLILTNAEAATARACYQR